MENQGNRRSQNGSIHVVGRPQTTDVIGRALRGAFTAGSLPEDMQATLHKLGLPRSA